MLSFLFMKKKIFVSYLIISMKEGFFSFHDIYFCELWPIFHELLGTDDIC